MLLTFAFLDLQTRQFIVKPPKGLSHRDSWSGRFLADRTSIFSEWENTLQDSDQQIVCEQLSSRPVSWEELAKRYSAELEVSVEDLEPPAWKAIVSLFLNIIKLTPAEIALSISLLSRDMSGNPSAHNNIEETFRTRERRKAINLLIYPNKNK